MAALLNGLKKVPVPRSAKTVKEIKQHLPVNDLGAKLAPRSQFAASLMPSEVSPEELLPKSPKNNWYHVERSRAGRLPIYTDYNSAGGVWTEVRKITGNISLLREDLRSHLGLEKKHIWINDCSKRILIKGNHIKEVLGLLGKHF